MSKITGKVNYKEVLKGDTGYTFEPHVTVDGILYWTNNGNLENPLPVNLHGKQGFMFIPHVDSEGNLSWSNTGELENPPTVNIKGDKGYFYTPHISDDGILTWSNNGNLENPKPFNISDLILNEVKESRVDTTGKTFTKLKERLDSDFKKLSECIKNNDTKDEVVQARTATTGENFMTLDDRIDHEVMRLREKIEVTMLEQEDKESHDISNTIDGMSSDMVVKGRTLQNFKSNVKNYISKWVDNGDNYSLNLPSGSEQPSILYGLTQTLKENQKYTVIVNLIEHTSGVLHFSFMNSEGNKLASTIELAAESKGLKKFVFTINNTVKAETLRLLPRNGINNIYSISKNILILEGDWSNKSIPQYFESIKSFGQQEDKISILSNGKNLFDIKETKEATSSTVKFSEYDTIEFKQTAQDRVYLKCFGGFKAKTQYTLSLDIVSSKANVKFWIVYDDGTSTKFINSPVTSELGKTILRIQSDAPPEGEKITTIIKNIQLEEGASKTLYTKPIQYKKDILLQDLGFDEGLRGINDISDELNSLRNVAIKRIGKREYREGDLLLGNVITDKVNTYYVLEEPIETPLDENINVKTFNDKTYVNFENSINGTSSFKVPVNTNKLINDLKFEKEDLKEKFNNLTNEFENFKTLMIQTLPYKGV